MQKVVMLNVIYAVFRKLAHHAECHYAECHHAECHHAECHYAECRYAECQNLKNTSLFVQLGLIEVDTLKSRSILIYSTSKQNIYRQNRRHKATISKR
jgi:hypothetical protein